MMARGRGPAGRCRMTMGRLAAALAIAAHRFGRKAGRTPAGIRRAAPALVALLAAGPVAAHPHAFTDTAFRLILGADGRAEAVEITWVYDELTSLMVVEDRGVDPSGTGQASEEERVVLQGFDQNWDPGFPGDFYIRQGGRDLVLSAPFDQVADYRDGKLVSTFRRRIEPPADASIPLSVQSYDPTFYTAYTVTSAGVEGGDDCAVATIPADTAAAQEKFGAALAAIPADQVPDESQFGDVGRLFADEVRITCPAR